MRYVILFIVCMVIAVIPASAQAPAPSGDFGYDDFIYPLDTYSFWSLYDPADVYSGGDYLVINFNNPTDRIQHTIWNFNSQLATIRVRFKTAPYPDGSSPEGVRRYMNFEMCGDLLDYNRIDSNGNPWIVGDPCGTYQIVADTYYEMHLSFRRETGPIQLSFKPRLLSSSEQGFIYNMRIEYFSVECWLLCGDIGGTFTPTPSRTPIIFPTSIPRTNTPNPTYTGAPPTLPPIELTRPSSSTSEPDCGVYQCGSLDQSFPVLPPLSSPTPLIIGDNEGGWVTQVPLVTSVANGSTPTPLVNYDGGGNDLNDYIIGDGVLVPSDPDTGLPIQVDFETVLSPQNNLFIAYIKGLYTVNEDYYGSFAPLVQITLGTLTILMFITGARVILPIAIILIGLIRKAWGALMDLIPF